MSNEEWEAVQEGWHRKNLNNLYLKLKEGGLLHLNETERQHLCNALKWAGNEIGSLRYEIRFMDQHDGYHSCDGFACQITD